jgi:hypothetical protein
MGVESSAHRMYQKCIYNFDKKHEGKYFLKDLSVRWEDNIAKNIRNSNWWLWTVFMRFRTESNEGLL